MERLFVNSNGRSYAIVKGGKGKRSLLINIYSNECVVCAILEDDSWWQGNYFEDFDEAYKFFKEEK